MKTTHSDRGFTLVELLVVIAIIGILVALLLPAIQAAREAARRSQCQSNIKNVALAVLNYESNTKTLPNGMTFNPTQAGGVSTLRIFGPNWVINILPYLEEQALYDQFELDLPINNNTSSVRNREARGKQLSIMLCPSDENNQVLYMGTSSAAQAAQHGDNWARGNYAANAGRAFIYPGNDELYMSGPDSLGWKDNCKRGVMGPNVAVELKRITDGTSKTILVAEIRTGLDESDARGVWAMGHAGPSLLAAYGAGADDNGPNNCIPNGDDIYAGTSGNNICGSAAAKAICMDCFGGNVFDQATSRSVHTGGVFIALCDGSVQFISDEIETSGAYGNCCTPWDYMIASGDGGKGGRYNRVVVNPCF